MTLRESFTAINARFHLVGVYTLVELFLRFAVHWSRDDPAGLPLVLAALILFFTTYCGILGMVYQAAAGRPQHAAVRWAGALFLPLVWLSIKIDLIVYGMTALAAAVYQGAWDAGAPFDKALEAVVFWAFPFLGFGTQALALYSTPLCVLSRTRGEWRPNIREGLRFFRSCSSESRRLLLVLLVMMAAGGALHYAQGPDGSKAPPGYPEGLVLFVNSYLALVVFFAATRVVLARPAAGHGEILPDTGTAAPGPPA
ncbi:MAG: hypothetical protein HYS34_00415 [Acidobacteria bacterium]|nr:hypothetical protein [Acidobacteriota bacterium]